MDNFLFMLQEEIKARRLVGVARQINVSRRAIYDWLEGKKPIEENYLKVKKLYESRLSGELRGTIFNGK